jgi:hypothetical protein
MRAGPGFVKRLLHDLKGADCASRAGRHCFAAGRSGSRVVGPSTGDGFDHGP